MFKTGTRAALSSLLIYISYIYLFKETFAPLDYGFWFYVIAFIHGCGLLGASSFIGDSSTRKTASMLIMIICTIIATSIVLATMVLNQHEIRNISWFWQAIIAAGTILFITGPLIGHALDHGDAPQNNAVTRSTNVSGHRSQTSESRNIAQPASENTDETPTVESIFAEDLQRISSERKRLLKIRGRINVTRSSRTLHL